MMISPSLQEHLDKLDAIDKIPMLDCLSKLTDAYLLIHRSITLIDNAEEDMVREFLSGSRKMIEGMDFFVEDPKRTTEEQRVLEESVFTLLEEHYRDKVQKSQLILANQVLVMFCTIFDNYLDSCLNIVLKRKPEILIGTAEEKKLTLKEIVDLGDYESIISKIRDKEVSRFSREGIEYKMGYFKNNLGMRVQDFFNWQSFTEEIQERYAGWGLVQLQEIFDKRHAVVHRNESPIIEMTEIDMIVEFMNSIILNISPLLARKFKIPTDMAYNVEKALIIQGEMTIERYCEIYDIHLD